MELIVQIDFANELQLFERLSLVMVAQKLLFDYFSYGFVDGVEGFAESAAKDFTNNLMLQGKIIPIFILLLKDVMDQVNNGIKLEDIQIRVLTNGIRS